MKTIDVLYQYLHNPKMISFVVMFIIFDVFIGVLRSIKEKRMNSSIGIDGLIRKTAMIGCLSFLLILDFMLNINFIGWLPEQLLNIFQIIGLSYIGISDIFGVLFISFEILSIFKNWSLLELPILKGLNIGVSQFLETFTDELPTIDKNTEDKVCHK